jgi:hypothetical protein
MSEQQSSLADKDVVNVAMMTAGGLAPCLSSSIAQLVHYWVAALRAGQIKGLSFRFYRGGYKGLLTGDSFILPESEWDKCAALNDVGGSPIGNSRVKVSLNQVFRILEFLVCLLFLTRQSSSCGHHLLTISSPHYS